ncbi:MAG: hypothetical protein ACI9N1_002967, partial [Flavobacteriales bacterium]
GCLIQTKTLSTTGMVAYRLPALAGVYFLKITYSDGRFDAVRIVKE